MPIEELLHLDDQTKHMLDLSSSTDFDIFSIRKWTKENELITITTYLLHKHRLF